VQLEWNPSQFSQQFDRGSLCGRALSSASKSGVKPFRWGILPDFADRIGGILTKNPAPGAQPPPFSKWQDPILDALSSARIPGIE
jgi:hypothetical protein